jgi:hypothetical protein
LQASAQSSIISGVLNIGYGHENNHIIGNGTANPTRLARALNRVLD